jgi:tetratricopeptide (TPR) repeat protein
VLCLVLLATLSYQPLQAASSVETLVSGNQLYEKGNFAEATQLYEQLANQGVADSTLYYNLGNAYYKQGDLGRAILNYTRAARLTPRDADVQANLALARSQVADKYSSTAESFTATLIDLAQGWLTLNELAGLALLLWWLVCLLVLLMRRPTLQSRLAWLRPVVWSVGVLWIGALVTLGAMLYQASSHPPAIVVGKEVKVVSGPGERYVTEFILHAGAEVSLLEQRGDWVRITLPGDQLQGWAPTTTVALVQPGNAPE